MQHDSYMSRQRRKADARADVHHHELPFMEGRVEMVEHRAPYLAEFWAPMVELGKTERMPEHLARKFEPTPKASPTKSSGVLRGRATRPNNEPVPHCAIHEPRYRSRQVCTAVALDHTICVPAHNGRTYPIPLPRIIKGGPSTLSDIASQSGDKMKEQQIQSTPPVLSTAATLSFSAYGFGWGYRSFSLPYETVRERLGARDATEKQMKLAFELNQRRILQAVKPCGETPYQGETIPVPIEKL